MYQYNSVDESTFPLWNSYTADGYCETGVGAGRTVITDGGELQIFTDTNDWIWLSGSKKPCSADGGFCPVVSKNFGGGIINNPLCHG